MVAIWTKDPVGFEGEFYHIPESRVGPKPLQKPHPPIYVAGFGKYAFERAAKYGNGWNPSGALDWDWLEAMIKQLHETARAAGAGPMAVVLRAFTMVFPKSAPKRQPMMGTLQEIKEDIQRMRSIGVTEIVHSPPSIGFAGTIDQGIREMELLIEISK